MASSWTLTVAGVTVVSGNTCDNCSHWNGTHTLVYDSTPYGASTLECYLPGPFQTRPIREPGEFGGFVCTDFGGVGWLLSRGSPSTDVWLLQANSNGTFRQDVASYILPSGVSFKPFKPNLFEIFSSNADNCEGWPETLTIEPICE